jgi:hypothetical protein
MGGGILDGWTPKQSCRVGDWAVEEVLACTGVLDDGLAGDGMCRNGEYWKDGLRSRVVGWGIGL